MRISRRPIILELPIRGVPQNSPHLVLGRSMGSARRYHARCYRHLIHPALHAGAFELSDLRRGEVRRAEERTIRHCREGSLLSHKRSPGLRIRGQKLLKVCFGISDHRPARCRGCMRRRRPALSPLEGPKVLELGLVARAFLGESRVGPRGCPKFIGGHADRGEAEVTLPPASARQPQCT